jgi:hypothetical protein
MSVDSPIAHWPNTPPRSTIPYMYNTPPARRIATVLLWLTAFEAPADAPPECSRFSWNMSHELDVFEGPAAQADAGTTSATSARIDVDALYAVALHPQPRVEIVHAPGEPPASEGAHAGLVGFRTATPARYRVTVDSSLRIDIVGPNGLIDSAAFQAVPGCPLIYKSVEFMLPGGVDLFVQLTGSSSPRARMAITRAPGN